MTQDIQRKRIPFKQLRVSEAVSVLANFLKLVNKEKATKTRMNLSEIEEVFQSTYIKNGIKQF